MGAPAGLKLNSVFSNALGKFFLYHVHLWVTFIYLVAPFVSQGEPGSIAASSAPQKYYIPVPFIPVLSETLTILSYCGFCLQLSLAQDTFNLITFHIHCFYAYARRLFLCQTSGIVSLWRLFR